MCFTKYVIDVAWDADEKCRSQLLNRLQYTVSSHHLSATRIERQDLPTNADEIHLPKSKVWRVRKEIHQTVVPRSNVGDIENASTYLLEN